MSLCAACALQLSDDMALCPHHHGLSGDDWATTNRLMCDFVHRGRIPPRTRPEPEEEVLEYAQDAA